MADRYAAVRRGDKALEQATLTRVRADEASRYSLVWFLKGLARRSHALSLCRDAASTVEAIQYFEVMVKDAFYRAHEYLDARDRLLDETLAFEMRSRIAYEEAEERYATAPDDDWEKLVNSIQSSR